MNTENNDQDNVQENNSVQEENINCPICNKVWDEEDPDGCEYYKNLCSEEVDNDEQIRCFK